MHTLLSICILHADVDILHVYIFVVYKYILYIFGFVVSEKNQTLEVRYYYPCWADSQAE